MILRHVTAPRADAPRPLLPLTVLVMLAACGGGDEAAGTAARAASAAGEPSVVTAPARPYREVAGGGAGGTLRVLAVHAGALSPDTASGIPAGADSACARTPAPRAAPRRGDGLADVVVWLPDVREGRALPVERRHELVVDGCRLEPHVQVAVAGGTLNLRVVDGAEHRTRFVRRGDGRVLAELATTEPMSVIPSEQVLREPGQVQVTCERHPWARAWIFAFDHPYAAVGAPDGTAVLRDVPPGRWRVLAWHDRLGLREGTAQVAEGREAVLRIDFAGPPASPAAPAR